MTDVNIKVIRGEQVLYVATSDDREILTPVQDWARRFYDARDLEAYQGMLHYGRTRYRPQAGDVIEVVSAPARGY